MKSLAVQDVRPRVSMDTHFSLRMVKWYYFFILHLVDHVNGVRLCLWTAATNRPTVHPLDHTRVWTATVEWCWQGKTGEIWEKICIHATLSITNRTCNDMSANPGLRCKRPATNQPSQWHGLSSFLRCQWLFDHIKVRLFFFCFSVIISGELNFFDQINMLQHVRSQHINFIFSANEL
jgi:hypothetical protein